jgi:hypothetical protein
MTQPEFYNSLLVSVGRFIYTFELGKGGLAENKITCSVVAFSTDLTILMFLQGVFFVGNGWKVSNK